MSVQAIIHSLTLMDFLPIQTYKPYSDYRLLLSFTGPNQVDEFLSHHRGPGIQHIGLHTDDIIDTVSQLKNGGVQFAEPPYTYYTEVLYKQYYFFMHRYIMGEYY